MTPVIGAGLTLSHVTSTGPWVVLSPTWTALHLPRPAAITTTPCKARLPHRALPTDTMLATTSASHTTLMNQTATSPTRSSAPAMTKTGSNAHSMSRRMPHLTNTTTTTLSQHMARHHRQALLRQDRWRNDRWHPGHWTTTPHFLASRCLSCTRLPRHHTQRHPTHPTHPDLRCKTRPFHRRL